MSLEEPTWDASTFSKNRDRLLKHDVATKFFDAVVRMARGEHLLSDEHLPWTARWRRLGRALMGCPYPTLNRKEVVVASSATTVLSTCFASHLLEDGHDIRTAQKLLGHVDVSTTMISTHVLQRRGLAARSPADS